MVHNIDVPVSGVGSRNGLQAIEQTKGFVPAIAARSAA
jgi:hypothetical protein